MNPRLLRTAAVLATLGVLGAFMAGCQKKPAEPALTPKIAPPAIKQAGVLRVAIDPTQPPFAGAAEGQTVGMDVDVAAAVAERLGLKLELVELGWKEIPKAVANRTVDLGLGAIPITEAVLADVSVAGSYATDGIGLFAVTATGTGEATAALSAAEAAALVADAKVGCQKESPAQWFLESEFWEGYAKTYDTLRAAFDALKAGEIDYVACDAFVGAYLARDYDSIRFIGPLGEPAPLGALVAKDSAELEMSVREVLDAMAADGTLAAIRAKWVGDLPDIRADASAEQTGTP
ncbi:MAG: ABC transporter substrate-binding protein [Anaerosomatales bacterium]|nr:ABC transporter substrate-binding protein [Anaerosomatales bacterium]